MENIKWWYFSFADADKPEGTQFLGGCIVKADSPANALTVTHLTGCNPGGEAQIIELPDGIKIPPEYSFKILNADEIENMPEPEGLDLDKAQIVVFHTIEPTDTLARSEEFIEWLKEHDVDPDFCYKVEIGKDTMLAHMYAKDNEGKKYTEKGEVACEPEPLSIPLQSQPPGLPGADRTTRRSRVGDQPMDAVIILTPEQAER